MPPGKVIASNGKKLWAFDSTTEVCGVQGLYMEDKEKGGLGNRFRKVILFKVKGKLYQNRFLDDYTIIIIGRQLDEWTFPSRRGKRRSF